MPKNLRKELSKAKVAKRLIQWAETTTDAWLSDRAGTPEDIKNKPLTRDAMVSLALIAYQADDIRISEIVAHGKTTLPGPDTWMPGPQMWMLIRTLYLEFGYVIEFLADARHAMDRGFSLRKGPSGKKVWAFWPDDKDNPGCTKATEAVIRSYMRSPAFARAVAEFGENKDGGPGLKDVRDYMLKLRKDFSVKDGALKDAMRKREPAPKISGKNGTKNTL